MSKLEKFIVSFIENNMHLIFFCIVTIIGFLVRYIGKDFISGDMENYLIPWYNEVRSYNGFSSLSHQIGDYNILYQTIISIISYTNFNCVYIYKLISIFFDYMLAYSSATFYCKLSGTPKFDFSFNSVYSLILLLPTTVLNSSFWGQCDSIYTFFVVLMLMYMYEGHYKRAFVFLGLAFSFKLQTVFILPFTFFIYFLRKDFSILNYIISIAVFWLSGIAGIINGRNFMSPFTIYAAQTGEFRNMYMNYPSFWVLVSNSYYDLYKLAIIIALTLCGIGLYLLWSSGRFNTNGRVAYIAAAAWVVWTCILFLPAMHERYAYILDILLIILAVVNIRYAAFAFTTSLLSLITYSICLWGNTNMTKIYALVNLISYVVCTIYFINKLKFSKPLDQH